MHAEVPGEVHAEVHGEMAAVRAAVLLSSSTLVPLVYRLASIGTTLLCGGLPPHPDPLYPSLPRRRQDGLRSSCPEHPAVRSLPWSP